MSEWAQAKNILAVRLDAMGDVLMTTPALRALKAGGRRISLLTSRSGAAIAPLIPAVDEVLVYEAPWMKAGGAHRDAAVDAAMIATLRGQNFDAAVIFTVYSQSPLPAALMCYLAGIPRTLAYCRENPYRLLSDWQVETEPAQGIRHEVQRHLDLVAAIGAQASDKRLSLRVPARAMAAVGQRLKAIGIPAGERFIVLHPGATAPSRRYPVEHFAAAARELVARGHTVVLTGGPGERELCAELMAQCGSELPNLAGALSLGELVALIARAQLLIGNNSGPAHIAAAVGTPVVDLYALTNPQHTPWQVPARVLSHDVECKYCYKSVCPAGHHRCLREIAPARVVAAALSLLAQDAPVMEDAVSCTP